MLIKHDKASSAPENTKYRMGYLKNTGLKIQDGFHSDIMKLQIENREVF